MSTEAAKPLQFCTSPELPGTTQPAEQARAQEEAARTVYVGVLLSLHEEGTTGVLLVFLIPHVTLSPALQRKRHAVSRERDGEQPAEAGGCLT